MPKFVVTITRVFSAVIEAPTDDDALQAGFDTGDTGETLDATAEPAADDAEVEITARLCAECHSPLDDFENGWCRACVTLIARSRPR